MTERDYLRLTRDGYDRTAGPYADRLHDHLRDKPLDLAMLSGFAGLVGAGGDVADVGCGTGATTATLTDAGLDAVGIDLSPNMIEQARRLNPALTFHVGAMAALPLGDRPRVLTEAFGERVSLTFYWRRPDAVAGMLDAAGLKPYAQLVRELDDDGLESTPQAYLIGRKG